MGLIKTLALLPVAPLRLTVWVGEKLREEADRQESSPASAVQQIDALEQAREKGHLDDEQTEELQGQVIEERMTGPPTEPEKDEQRG